MDEMLWWSVVTETPAGQTNVIGPFLLYGDAVEWATRWMQQGFGRAGIASLMEPEEAANLAGFDWIAYDPRVS